MKAEAANFLKFIKKSPQFTIPIYQRNYSWKENQCKQLWEDLLLAGNSKNIKEHFIGSIIYIERDLSTVMMQEVLQIIDGQQRLTTVTLLIAALAEYFEENSLGEILGDFSAKKLREYYLINPLDNDERRYKLILSETDKETLLSIIKEKPLPNDKSSLILNNYEYFKKQIRNYTGEIEDICQGLAKLFVVGIALDRFQDNPQLIFESMNSTGLDLSQADLIRNYILMDLELQQQKDLYQDYWRPMEKSFKDNYADHFDAFMRHYITAQTGEIPNIRDVYSAFKTFSHNYYQGNITKLVSDLYTYAQYYCAIVLGAEEQPKLKYAFYDLRELKVDVAYPFLLNAYHEYRQERLTVDTLEKIVRLVESYVFRRAICNIPTNSLNKTFAGLTSSIRTEKYLESLQATLLLLPSYRRFPQDEEFQRELKQKDLYNFRSRLYWLRRLENYGRKEPISIENYTIEHILPQNKNLSDAWQKELGTNWQEIQQKYLHTLGNITLTGYNSEYSDRPFSYKKNQITNSEGKNIGFKYSPLYLNEDLSSTTKWDETAILARASRLAKKACKVWPIPQLDNAILDIYHSTKDSSTQQYSIDTHPHLKNDIVQPLFKTLRSQILALDSCVHEEFLKLYVAYKVETNFVDIIPQAKRLKLSLNMPYAEINDPENLCVNVSHLGRWGNGDVEVILDTPEKIPYIMGLIRQSFDYQIGGY